ncbi:MAG: HNH endonuclease [Actinomycetota bacterium]
MDERQLGRAARLERILERDGARCVWCARDFDGRLIIPTTEHLVPRIKGGPSWIENELAACRRCNSQRGHQAPDVWLRTCDDRGWPADRDRIVVQLEALRTAIAARGGQRRARPYIATQLRRLGRERGQD